ncbi:MAG: hypothetical protein FJ319_10575 [SAR202 cluster bacterium]|nr:hypothetical protein [SAR202 cluster bacterium]
MLYQIMVVIHILASVILVGGGFLLGTVAVPTIRKEVTPPPAGFKLIGQIGRRFRPISWTMIGILVVTGLYLMMDHWSVSFSDLLTGDGHFVRYLQAKVGFVGLAIALAATHDFILGPRVAERMQKALAAGGPIPQEVIGLRMRMLMLARLNGVVGIIIIVIAGLMIRP